jgi:isopentenyldiphosphate isomerase
MRPVEPDPTEEFFDVVDRDGIPTGEIKRRSDVHQDGDWHRAFHCWVALRSPDHEPAILFQRRSHNKDTYPGHLDVAVGGHYRAGEGFEDVVREIEEELGICPPTEGLVNVGRRWAEGITDSWIDREIEDVYVHCLEQPVDSLRPAFEEITAVDVITSVTIEALFAGRMEQASTLRYPVQPDNTLAEAVSGVVTLEDFIPVRDEYWLEGARVAVSVLNGEPGVRLTLS